jgi:hypothetical protein
MASERSALNVDPVATLYQPSNVIFIDQDSPGFPQAETFMEWSILNTLCCFFTGSIVLICSIPALCFSIKARELNADRDYVEAKKASVYSRTCNFIASVLIIQFLILIIIVTNLLNRNYL